MGIVIATKLLVCVGVAGEQGNRTVTGDYCYYADLRDQLSVIRPFLINGKMTHASAAEKKTTEKNL